MSRSEQNADSIWPFSLETLLDDLQATDWDEFDSSQYEGRDDDLQRVMELLGKRLSGSWAFMPMGDSPPYIDDFFEGIAYPPSDYGPHH